MTANNLSDIKTTPKELALEYGVSARAIVLLLKRKEIGSFGEAEELPEDVIEYVIKHYSSKKKKKAERTTSKPKDNTEPTSTSSTKWELPEINQLDVINYLEMGLILLGLSQLFSWAGAILSIMICLLLHKSQTIAKNPKLKRANDKSLQVVLWICIASFFLHYITFWNASTHLFTYHQISKGEEVQLAFFDNQIFRAFCAFLPAMFVSISSYKAVEITIDIASKK